MNFEFSEEQELLREQARGFLKDNCSMQVVRDALESDGPFNADLWKGVAELGWTAVAIPERFGGLGMSYVDLSVIADEMGRAVAPLPFSSSVYLATEAIIAYGSESQQQTWLPKLASGEILGAYALKSMENFGGIPILLVLDHRGDFGEGDGYWYFSTGRIVSPLLEALQIPFTIVDETAGVADAIVRGARTVEASRRPAAVLLGAGVK